jgi:hypothetical protein
MEWFRNASNLDHTTTKHQRCSTDSQMLQSRSRSLSSMTVTISDSGSDPGEVAQFAEIIQKPFLDNDRILKAQSNESA